MTFGEKLSQLRHDHNLSQEQMAELLDVSRQSISKWESDKSFPETKRLLFICDHFDVSLDYMLLNKDPKENLTKQEKYTGSFKQSLVTLLDNMNPTQKAILYGITVTVLASAALFFSYQVGAGIGKFLYNIKH